MGLCNCRDKRTPTKDKNFTFLKEKLSVEPPTCTEGSQDVKEEIKNSELDDEARDTVASKPLKIPPKKSGFHGLNPVVFKKAKSCPMDSTVVMKHRRKNSAPSALSIHYSISNNLQEQTLHIDESILEDLTSTKPRQQSMSQRFQIRRKSSNLAHAKRQSLSKKPKKKVRFDDNVIIHRIEAAPGIPTAMPETYKLVITMREVWLHLDLDRDKHLNIDELRRFCNEVWEEPDSDVYDIMKLYAKVDPDKGINFNEWCSLIKDEDPDLKELVDDLYTIFVEESETTT